MTGWKEVSALFLSSPSAPSMSAGDAASSSLSRRSAAGYTISLLPSTTPPLHRRRRGRALRSPPGGDDRLEGGVRLVSLEPRCSIHVRWRCRLILAKPPISGGVHDLSSSLHYPSAASAADRAVASIRHRRGGAGGR